jgi:hypothetical protein
MREAAARIKINGLLEAAGWRFFADDNAPADIQLEPGVRKIGASPDWPLRIGLRPTKCPN